MAIEIVTASTSAIPDGADTTSTPTSPNARRTRSAASITIAIKAAKFSAVPNASGLVNRPPAILADEPTAPLDSVRALAMIRILNDMAVKFGTAIIVVTHDEKIIPTFRRIYHIRDGVTHEEAGEGRGFDTGP